MVRVLVVLVVVETKVGLHSGGTKTMSSCFLVFQICSQDNKERNGQRRRQQQQQEEGEEPAS